MGIFRDSVLVESLGAILASKVFCKPKERLLDLPKLGDPLRVPSNLE